MKKISSIHNEEIKAVAKLSAVKGRREQGRFKAEGLRVCETLIKSRCSLIQVYCLEPLLNQIQQFCSSEYITVVNEIVMHKISTAATPSGVVAVLVIPSASPPEKLTEGLVLYDCTDPGNMGTLLRTCAAMGRKSAVIIGGTDPWSPKVIQSSAGNIGSLTLFQWSWSTLMAYKKNLKICALVVSNGQKPDEINFSDTLIMVGNEAHGIPDHVVTQSDLLLTLEMPGKIESLNAAVAGSIALYLAWYSK